MVHNLVLFRDHFEDPNKIHDSYKSKMIVVVDHHKDPNVYIIQLLNKKGPKETVNSCLIWKSLRRIKF